MRNPCPESLKIINRIFVGSLPLHVNSDELHRFFVKLSGSAHIKDVKIIKDIRGNSMGFA